MFWMKFSIGLLAINIVAIVLIVLFIKGKFSFCHPCFRIVFQVPKDLRKGAKNRGFDFKCKRCGKWL